MRLLSLGLNFSITPTAFPLTEYITAAEVLCRRIEETKDEESFERAEMIQHTELDELKKSYRMKIHQNLSREEKRMLKELVNDDSIIICPADKGKAIAIEDIKSYMSKLQDQLDEGDYELVSKNEKTILRKLHRKLMDQLISMGITTSLEQRKYAVTAPVMASIYLLIKVHKKNFPGRAVVSQIDDPTYKLCKVLTDILRPLDKMVPHTLKTHFS
jgi:hypothetical protein